MARIKIDDIPEDDSLDDKDLNEVAGGFSRIPSTLGDIQQVADTRLPDGPTIPGVSLIPPIPSLSITPNLTNNIIMNSL